MKLKLTDKIRKFFGQNARTDAANADYRGLQQLEGTRPHLLRSTDTSVSIISDMRPGAGLSNAGGGHHAPGAGELHEKSHMPSTLSQKADLSSNPRTTGQDESYSLQNEVYFPQLLLTLQTGTPEQKAVAAEALFNYTAESDSARQRATQAGVVAHLIDLLVQGTDHGKMYAAYTLSSLTSIEESLEQMCALGAIPALISILSNCPLLVCKKGAMRALGRLARNDEAAADIVSAGGLAPIIGLLTRPDSSLVRRCLIALYFIGADKDGLQQAIGAAGALPHLMALARNDSPDVQAEATDVLKVLCRNSACGRTLADMGGIDVLSSLVHCGLTSRTKASAARALQRLNDIPELKEQLACSSARDMLSEGNSNNSLLNTGAAATAAPSATGAAASAAAATLAAATIVGAASAAIAAGAQPSTIGAGSAAGVARSAAPAANAGSQCGAAAAGSGAAGEPVVVEVDDVRQLAEVLASSSNRWLREKAAAAVEQLAADDPQACRELADLGVLGSLLDMLSAGNSSITRRAAARALGKLGDDSALLKRMGETPFILKLLQAAPELSGSAQRSVMKLLQALAGKEETLAAFPKQQCTAHLMQIIEGAALHNGAAAATAAGGSAAGAASEAAAAGGAGCISGGSSRGDLGAVGLADGPAGVDAGVAVRALDVLVAVCTADAQVLGGVKEFPGGFRLLVTKLQHGPRMLTPPILKLLACLAKSQEHQEDLLKGGVVPVLLGLYRSDDAGVAMQAAKVMESLSEPAAQILERSLSKGDMAAGAAATAGAERERAEAIRGLSPLRGGQGRAASSSSSPIAQQSGLAGRGVSPARLKDKSSSSSSGEGGSSSLNGAGTVAAEAAAAAGGASSSGSSSSSSSHAQAGGQSGDGSSAAGSSAADVIERQRAGRGASPRGTVAAAVAAAEAAAAAAAVAAGTAAAPTPRGVSAGRASSLGLGGSSGAAATSKFTASPGRASKSFTSKRGPVGQVDVIGADDVIAAVNGRSASPFRSQQRQQQQQQQADPSSQQQPAAGSKLPRRPLTPEATGNTNGSSGSSSARQQAAAAARAGAADNLAAANKQEPSAAAVGSSSCAAAGGDGSPAAAAGAAAGSTPSSSRAASASKDRPAALGLEQLNRPPARSRAASARPSPTAAGPAAQRQRLIAGRKPSLSHLNLNVGAQQQQQQQQPQQQPDGAAAAAQAGGSEPHQASRPSALQMAGAAAASPIQQPQVQQQQQQQQPSGSSTPGPASPGPGTPAAEPSSIYAAAAGAAAAADSTSAAAAEQQGGSSSGAAAAAGHPSGRSPDKVLGASGGSSASADADDLLSSTYDNLHGLLMKKSDIEICRTSEGRKCRLGEGGFGVVYKAVMNGVDEVAVKLVKADSPSRKELELFLKEVQTLAKLHHRNIVQFYGACLETGSMFFVTELMKGGDLYTALRHHSETMRWERLGRKVALDVALGLNYLHAQRPPMMHRDLKSPNVLLSEEGVAKIADVGMVRSQVKDLVTAQPVMTPLWAAPEVVRHERASIKADIWSYGILIWELISGEDITEYQPLSISRQVGPSPNAKAMSLPAKCPPVARKLFMACTQMDPERRPAAQSLVEWLRADMVANRF